MTVVAGGGSWVGIAAEGFDIERHDETGHGTAETWRWTAARPSSALTSARRGSDDFFPTAAKEGAA